MQFLKRLPDTQAVEICCLQDACCPQTSNGGECATSPLTACALPRQVLSSAFNSAILQNLPAGFSKPVILDFFSSVVTFISSCLLPKLLMSVYKPAENKGAGDAGGGRGSLAKGDPLIHITPRELEAQKEEEVGSEVRQGRVELNSPS